MLVTGCGEGSIGIECVRLLLEGGATVVVTTSSFNLKKTQLYRQLYRENGSRGAKLVVLPFNQASKRDVEKLVSA